MDHTDIRDRLVDLSRRVNVMTREAATGQLIVIYDDHRWLLNVLFKLFKDQLLDRPNLIYFDAHDDAAMTQPQNELLSQIGVENLSDATEKQFGAFVDYDRRTDDSDWLLTAMELELIGDACNIGNRHSTNIKELNGKYLTEAGIEHKIYSLSDDISYEIGCRGSLGDRALEDNYREIRDFFGIEHSYEFGIGDMHPYVLDFDLDFFTMSFTDESCHGWTEKVFRKHFPYESDVRYFVYNLIEKAQIITICREPDYCGSIGDSNRIMELLDRFLFGGRLGTEPTL